jgi:hypothetical protein
LIEGFFSSALSSFGASFQPRIGKSLSAAAFHEPETLKLSLFSLNMAELRLVGRWDLLPALSGDISRHPFFFPSTRISTPGNCYISTET